MKVQTFIKWKFTSPGLNFLLFLSTVALIPKGITHEQQGMMCKENAAHPCWL